MMHLPIESVLSILETHHRNEAGSFHSIQLNLEPPPTSWPFLDFEGSIEQLVDPIFYSDTTSKLDQFTLRILHLDNFTCKFKNNIWCKHIVRKNLNTSS
jgi:hypothetical protein